jgi:hypothetical protein
MSERDYGRYVHQLFPEELIANTYETEEGVEYEGGWARWSGEGV